MDVYIDICVYVSIYVSVCMMYIDLDSPSFMQVMHRFDLRYTAYATRMPCVAQGTYVPEYLDPEVHCPEDCREHCR